MLLNTDCSVAICSSRGTVSTRNNSHSLMCLDFVQLQSREQIWCTHWTKHLNIRQTHNFFEKDIQLLHIHGAGPRAPFSGRESLSDPVHNNDSGIPSKAMSDFSTFVPQSGVASQMNHIAHGSEALQVSNISHPTSGKTGSSSHRAATSVPIGLGAQVGRSPTVSGIATAPSGVQTVTSELQTHQLGGKHPQMKSGDGCASRKEGVGVPQSTTSAVSSQQQQQADGHTSGALCLRSRFHVCVWGGEC